MRIFLLTVKDAFNGGYDSYSGHVIRAENEENARAICPKGDEGDVWTDPDKSNCEALTLLNSYVNGTTCVILSSFHAG